ncbi:MAG TPA: AAA family ATPase [Kofleriaceae bacterium]|nr:AAA family ATPase [Kofleriaceae bacterium]
MGGSRERIDFTIERQRHARFVGREDVLARLDEWLLGPGDARWVVVTGGPGMGKSAILAAWLLRREAAGAVVPHHFVRRQVADWDQPEVIAASIAAQIEAAYPDLCDSEAKPERRLLELLGRVSKQLGSSGRLVVVVDGLDETRAEPGDNPLPRFLPHVVPAGIRFLCATRRTYPHLGWLEARNPVRRLDLDAPRWAASNEAVVRGFWEAVASEYDPPLPAATAAAAIARAEGNVLHAVMLHDTLRDLTAAERRVDRVPHGLKELIGEVWERAASHESVRLGLGLVCAAQEALSLDALTEVAGWSYEERERFVPSARQLLLEEPASWAGALAYRPRHDWVRELMVERLGAATVRAHHGTLARKLATWPAPREAAARRYALHHALTHRAEAGAWADAWRLAADMGFLEAKCRELGVHEAEADVARTAERCRPSGDEALRRRFVDLARALARESHWLREAPEATAALVWNQLRRSGWSTEDLDQQLLLSAGASFLRLRHVATSESPALERNLVGHTASVNACAVTPDGRRVVSASADTTLKVWDLETGQAVATLQGHTDLVLACAVTPDGRRVVSASADTTLKVWDLETGQAVATLQGHAHSGRACAVTPNGRCVVSTADDMTLKVWDLETGQAIATLQGHVDFVRACAVTPDGRRVVSASHDTTLKVWDLETGQAVATLQGHGTIVNACAVTPDGRRVVSASHGRPLTVWDLETGQAVATLQGHTDSVFACAVTPDGRRVVSASHDTTLKVWDLAAGQAVATRQGHAQPVKVYAVAPDGRRVVAASSDSTFKVWDLETGQVIATLQGHAEHVTACAVTPDGRRVVWVSSDETFSFYQTFSDVKVWDLETGHAVAILQSHAGLVTACAVTPDGRRVVSALGDDTLKVWDLETGQAVATLQGHADHVTACAVTPDGRRVVSASRDTTLKVWDLETGQAVATLQGHVFWVDACAVTPDGRRVVSASADTTLKVWDLETGQAVATLQGHANQVLACAVTPDGRRVVSASRDKTLKVWDLESNACLFTHRANAEFFKVAATATAIIADDALGSVWFLDWPPSNRRESTSRDDRGSDKQRTSSRAPEPASQRLPMKHTILFLAANPSGTDSRALDREARAMQEELQRSGFRDRFELVTRWAAQPLDLLRELRALKPTVVHFTGRGGPDGLLFQTPSGDARVVSPAAIAETFSAAGSSVKLVILNACYSDAQADALLAHVDCVVGVSGTIQDDAARSFAIGFYGGLGEHESVAAAYKQGLAAISLEGPHDGTRPHLKVRADVDAGQLVLAAAPPASQPVAIFAAVAPPIPLTANSSAAPSTSARSKVDIGILTIRDDEFRALLGVFPSKAGTHKGTSREYALRHADAGDGDRYTVAVLRLVEQGHGEAQDAARDLIEDLAPRLVLVVGIAGGLPSDDVTLGDVVVSTRIHDFTVEARKTGQEPTYAVTGGPIDKALAAVVTNLAAREDELGSWTADLPPQPPVTWTRKEQLYGSPEWQRELRAKLEHHHGEGATPRAPVYAAGPIASSDRLVKDPELLIPWLQTARNLLAIEMESGGVYRAVRERCPMLAIRGISDIVGLKRADAWTKFACASAAAFTRAFLRTRPIEASASAGVAANPP